VQRVGEFARPLVVAELGHCNAAQGERRRVVAQRDALERTERITAASARAAEVTSESMAAG
jgi:hypothetical protein